MQQQRLPEGHRPKGGRSPIASPPNPTDLDLISRARRGEAGAIATLLNQKFHSRGIRLQGHRQGSRFALLVESALTPPRQSVVNGLSRELTLLQPVGIDKVEVYGRASGQRLPEWQDTIEIQPPRKAAETSNGAHFQLADWLRQGSTYRQQAFLSPAETAVRSNLKLTQFLRFYFTASETALLPLEGIKEVLKVPPAAILPVPQMPASVLGVYNCRGTILWLVDLGTQLGFESTAHQTLQRLNRSLRQEYTGQRQTPYRAPELAAQMLTAIVVEIEHKTLGLVVPAVLDIEQHPVQQMQPAAPELFSPQLLPFIQGLLTRSSSPVLSLAALVNDPVLQVHRQ